MNEVGASIIYVYFITAIDTSKDYDSYFSSYSEE